MARVPSPGKTEFASGFMDSDGIHEFFFFFLPFVKFMDSPGLYLSIYMYVYTHVYGRTYKYKYHINFDDV